MPPGLFRTVDVAHSGVGQRKAQGGTLGPLGPCPAFRHWSLLGIPGPWLEDFDDLTVPSCSSPSGTREATGACSLESERSRKGWSVGAGAGWDFRYPLRSSRGPPGTELKPSRQPLKPGRLTVLLPPDAHHLGWKKRVMDEEEDRDAPNSPLIH